MASCAIFILLIHKNIRHMKKRITFILSVALLVLLFQYCKEEDKNIIEDVDQLTALKNVSFTYDSVSYQIGLPEGALSGQSFDSLMLEDSAKYANPENYSVTVMLNMTANNTKENARDAKFDGMEAIIVLDTIENNPIQPTADAFMVEKDQIIPVQARDSVNLATHKLPCLYMFRQIVAGTDIFTTVQPVLFYVIGSQEGTLPIPETQHNIPTRATDEMKYFLSGLIESGIFEE